jgi:hypothetical protein
MTRTENSPIFALWREKSKPSPQSVTYLGYNTHACDYPRSSSRDSDSDPDSINHATAKTLPPLFFSNPYSNSSSSIITEGGGRNPGVPIPVLTSIRTQIQTTSSTPVYIPSPSLPLFRPGPAVNPGHQSIDTNRDWMQQPQLIMAGIGPATTPNTAVAASCVHDPLKTQPGYNTQQPHTCIPMQLDTASSSSHPASLSTPQLPYAFPASQPTSDPATPLQRTATKTDRGTTVADRVADTSGPRRAGPNSGIQSTGSALDLVFCTGVADR